MKEKGRLSTPVEIGQLYDVEIIGITHEGEGVGRANGFTLFVHGALPGERVRARVTRLKKQFGYAELAELLRRSEDRVEPLCAIYEQCGGCQLQHLSYEGQLRWKRQFVIDNLQRIGKLKLAEVDEVEAAKAGAQGVDGIIVHDVIGMRGPWRYRNKAAVQVGVGFGGEAGLVGGFYEQGSHRIVDMDTCLIQDERNDNVIRHVKRIAGELGIRAYDGVSGKGLLRHIVVRVGMRTQEMMIVLVTNGRRIPELDKLVGRLVDEIGGGTDYKLASICQNVNMQRTSLIFGDETHVLWGRDVIYDYIGDVKFAISARSFYQVNPVQTEVLYGMALDYAGLTGEETVVDAYCGIGTISLFLARRARKVYGVEIVEEAVQDARRNAEINGINNVEFAVGRAEDVLPRWQEQGIAADVIVVDPPRKGCDESLLRTILEMQPKRVVYVSCNPSTLARDLRVLEDGGYRTIGVQPVDMFPWTVHVEVVSLLVWSGTDGGNP